MNCVYFKGIFEISFLVNLIKMQWANRFGESFGWL